MAISVDDRVPLTLQQAQTSKDSLKFADIQKTFNILSEVPSTDSVPTEDSPAYEAQVSEILDTLKALQIAKKSLSDVQSITKDIKSNYKTEKNDAWAPIDDTMLRQRYEAAQQIKDILKNATFNNKNVFTIDYAKNGVNLDVQRKDINALNLRDEQSIDIFSYNINKLSQQIEENIQKLQDKIDKLKQSRWLSMENLRKVRIQPKEVNATVQTEQVPSLASILSQLSQQNVTNDSKISQDSIKENDENTEIVQNENTRKITANNITHDQAATESKTDSKDINMQKINSTQDSNISQQSQNLTQNSETQNPKPQDLAEKNEIKDGNIQKKADTSQASAEVKDDTNTMQSADKSTGKSESATSIKDSDADDNKLESTQAVESKDSEENSTQINDSKDTKRVIKNNIDQKSVENETQADDTQKKDTKLDDSKVADEKVLANINEDSADKNNPTTSESKDTNKNDTQNAVASADSSAYSTTSVTKE